ncbi:Na(+)/H(+) antiporter subunit B [Lederbergia panacisoli]|uniref:Na(+)/H(+) antiporter subunit B n=1 Tax=Lederbergia panacisoli TaxID=1255251 RepID=UPI00214CBDEE|nr:Na(+)/H(+) antiporter subunit B [Lederbergia panacisoli]MCR2822688.1 Na(+)/H(+) antiporter subunit B [Lederbergia panacisoli]
MKINDVILQTVTRIAVFIILTMAIYLFISGHNSPGGGFIGGLILASAFVLLCLAFDIETITNGIPLDFKKVAATGAFIVLGTGVAAIFFDVPFLSQTYSYINLPVVGKTALATVTFFEAGVALAVVGVVVTIISSISEDV